MKYKFSITGLDCPNCAAKLATKLSNDEMIEDAKINFLTEKLTVESSANREELISVIRSISKAFDSNIIVE